MFFKFKSKSYFKDLIPNDFVDIHSHVLSGVDDGAKTIEDSKFLLENMIAFGFKKIITTPHTFTHVWDNSPTTINKALQNTQENLSEICKQVPLKAASEYLLDDHFVNLFKKENLLTLKDKMVLVEMSYINPPIQLFDIIFDLQIAGYTPILAHPERYNFYHSNFEMYNKLKKAGCYFQMNMLSAVGYYGKPVAEIANRLLKNGMIDFVGSDFHHANHIAAFSNPIIIKEIDAIKKAATNNCSF